MELLLPNTALVRLFMPTLTLAPPMLSPQGSLLKMLTRTVCAHCLCCMACTACACYPHYACCPKLFSHAITHHITRWPHHMSICYRASIPTNTNFALRKPIKASNVIKTNAYCCICIPTNQRVWQMRYSTLQIISLKINFFKICSILEISKWHASMGNSKWYRINII